MYLQMASTVLQTAFGRYADASICKYSFAPPPCLAQVRPALQGSHGNVNEASGNGHVRMSGRQAMPGTSGTSRPCQDVRNVRNVTGMSRQCQ